MTSHYNRSEILSFWDLTDEQQAAAISDANDIEHAHERSYVECNGEILPLDMFMRSGGKVWDGIYSMTAFSAYFIKLSKCGTGCVVGYRYF